MAQDNKLSPNIRGLLAALGAYGIWGIFPLYMKAVAHIPVIEVVAHRIIWSVPTAAVIVFIMGYGGALLKAIQSPKVLALACVTSALITCNWSVYIWAIANNHAVDAALGYYINPLFNVVAGSYFLKERLNRCQWVAVGLALCAVILLTIKAGGLPWVAIALPLTFGFYSLLRKSLPIGPVLGFMLEALILFLPALIVAFYFVGHHSDHIIHGSWRDIMLLIGAGPITAIPLILFASGAKALNFITLGLMQYITPTMLFLIAVLVFHEKFSTTQLIAFGLIWTGLAIYTISSIRDAMVIKKPNTANI